MEQQLLNKNFTKALSLLKGLFLSIIAISLLFSVSYSNSITPSVVLTKMFNSVKKNVFGKEYENRKSLQLDGSLSVNTPLSTLSKKLKNINESASFSVNFSGTYLPNGEKKIDLSGDLGDIILSFRKGKNIIYSEDFEAYSLNRKGASSNLSNFRSFFNAKLNEIKNDMLNSGRWSLSINKSVVYGSDSCFKLTASTYIREENRRSARSRSQNFDDLITFWKRGTVVFFVRKSDYMPVKIEYENPIENIKSELVFAYGKNSKPIGVNVSGDAAGVFGSGEMAISYLEDGVMQSMSLDFSNQLNQAFSFSLSFNFQKNINKDSIMFIPPFGTQKMRQENLKLLILTNVAGTLLRMQQAGIKIKTLKF